MPRSLRGLRKNAGQGCGPSCARCRNSAEGLTAITDADRASEPSAPFTRLKAMPSRRGFSELVGSSERDGRASEGRVRLLLRQQHHLAEVPTLREAGKHHPGHLGTTDPPGTDPGEINQRPGGARGTAVREEARA